MSLYSLSGALCSVSGLCVVFLGSGISVRPKTMENDKFEKRNISLKNSSPDSKAHVSKKSLLGIWWLIFRRYDIIFKISHLM